MSMDKVVALIQVKAFARQDGVFLAILWLASFAATVWAPSSSMGSLLAIATPFMVGWLLKRFRDGALSGLISFRRGFAFSCFTFFYASMIFAIAQYLYLRFLDHGALLSTLQESMKAVDAIYRANGIATGDLKTGLALIGQLSPIQLTFTFMMQNIFIGFLLSFPIAWICKKNKQ